MGESGNKWGILGGVGELFRGATALTVDDKGRIAMPARYRERLLAGCNGQMVLTVSDGDPCLWLYPLPEWEEVERKLVRLPSLNKAARRLQRLLIGHATECELDGSGRILLPPLLREFANIEKRILLSGQGNKFELWNEDAHSRLIGDLLRQDENDLPDELLSLSL